MTIAAFRGISFKEALDVVNHQKYVKEERRDFQNGLATKEVFGPGIYFINDLESVTLYAFCHAEKENDWGAVLRQEIFFENPLVLNQDYREIHLRTEALNWKFGHGEAGRLGVHDASIPLVQWMGGIMKEYVLHLGYDGIIYHIDDDITYYISYFPERQVRGIQIDLVFRFDEWKTDLSGSD